jgi:hypothetical protein
MRRVKPPYAPFPLLSGEPIPSTAPIPSPDDPDVLILRGRRLQRIVPGDHVELQSMLYANFAI